MSCQFAPLIRLHLSKVDASGYPIHGRCLNVCGRCQGTLWKYTLMRIVMILYECFERLVGNKPRLCFIVCIYRSTNHSSPSNVLTRIVGQLSGTNFHSARSYWHRAIDAVDAQDAPDALPLLMSSSFMSTCSLLSRFGQLSRYREIIYISQIDRHGHPRPLWPVRY